MLNKEPLSDLQQQVLKAIPKNDVFELKTLLAQLQGTADFVDENGMTPLQHACYKGNTEFVQILLDQVSAQLLFWSIDINKIDPIPYFE